MNNESGRHFAISVTGGIGCGKSEVGQILKREGCPVLEADDVARDLVVPGSDALGLIVEKFGVDILQSDGSLSRKKLASRVFENMEDLRDLNSILHPLVLKRMAAWAAGHTSSGRSCAGIIPLLFEAGAERSWDIVVCVTSSDECSAKRLLARGWSEREIALRRAAQWNLEEKMKRADVVIENNGPLEQLTARVCALWKEILQKESQNG